jgi:AsmA-like C-terminal region
VKLLRIAVLVTAVLVIIAGGLGLLIYRNQDRLVRLMLSRVDAGTGMHIEIAGSSLEFRSHLMVLLDEPRIFRDGVEVARLKRVTASVSYHNLIYKQGLPLRALRAEQPVLTLPPETLAGGATAIPRLDEELRKTVAQALAVLGGVTRQLDIVGGTVSTAGAGPIASAIDLRAYHRRYHAERWYIRFGGDWMAGAAAGVRLGGAVTFGPDKRFPQDVILHGELRGGEQALRSLSFGTTTLDERSTGQLRFALHQDGRLSGEASATVRHLQIRDPRLTSSAELGDFALRFPFAASGARLEVSKLTLEHDQVPMLDASLQLDDLYGDDPALTVQMHGLRADLQALRKLTALLRKRPKWLGTVDSALRSGQLIIDQADFAGSFAALRNSPASELQHKLVASGELTAVVLKLPSDWGVPPLSQLGGKLKYARGTLTLDAGSAHVGKSTLNAISGRAELADGVDRIGYAIEARGELAADEVYAAALRNSPDLAKLAREKVSSVQGAAGLDLKSSGTLVFAKPAPPTALIAQFDPHPLLVTLKAIPRPLEITAGQVTIVPTTVTIDRVVVRAAEPGQGAVDTGAGAAGSGSLLVNGILARQDRQLTVRKLSAEVREVSAERWLPLVINPADLRLQGKINGTLFLEGAAGAKPDYRPSGRLALGPGQMQFGFLRSPMMLKAATLILDGHGMKLQMPAATIEQAPVDLSMSIRDFYHPEMELNAVAQRLDLLVMKFIRLPWSPPTPVMMFKIPVSGYLGARQAKLARLEMSDVGANYRYDHGDWRVRGFKADTLGGQIAMEISGRQKDDWIHIQGQLKQIDGAALMRLIKDSERPEMTGKVDVSGDLRADTNNNFFTTLEGKLSFNAQHGTLAKFRLLSRILGLIDLKSWLTANVPDPRVAGLPFDTLTASFAGTNGVFQTDDLALKGPVMDMGAQGSINVGQGSMDMTVEMVPFNTVNWLITKIPVLGEHLAPSTMLLAAYFRVSGPMSDPRVRVKPITSVAELVKKTLGLPINIIRPNTVR